MLWDEMLSVHEVYNWSVIDGKAMEPLNGNAVIIQLNPHLMVLSEGFAFQKPTRANSQF